MADVAWPTAYLPSAPLWAGFSMQPDPGVLRTPMESGLARQRRRFSTPLTIISVRWAMTPTQFVFFKSWISGAAAFGGAFFDITLRLDEDAARQVEARFHGKPRYTHAGVSGWIVDAELEVRDEPLISGEVIDAILAFGAEAIIAAGAAIDGVTLAPAFAEWLIGFEATDE